MYEKMYIFHLGRIYFLSTCEDKDMRMEKKNIFVAILSSHYAPEPFTYITHALN